MSVGVSGRLFTVIVNVLSKLRPPLSVVRMSKSTVGVVSKSSDSPSFSCSVAPTISNLPVGSLCKRVGEGVALVGIDRRKRADRRAGEILVDRGVGKEDVRRRFRHDCSPRS